MAEPSQCYDMIVVGSGAAGMTAALVGAIGGLDVLVVEKSKLIGGTSALSAGSVWIPNNLHGADDDSVEAALTFLESTVGNHASTALKQAFLAHGPAMVRLLEAESEVHFRAYPYHPDYLADAPGATLRGRVIEPLPFDGRLLGADFVRLRPPLPEFTVLGGMMINRGDIQHLLNAHHSIHAFGHAAKLVGRHAIDRLRYRRGTRLVMGNALVGRLVVSLRQRKVPIWTNCTATGLSVEGGRVVGLQVKRGRECMTLTADRGVVLASGGFAHHPELRAARYPQPTAVHSVVPAAIRGDGIDLARAAGARLSANHANPAFWAPASVRRRADGSTAVFPHFVLDRGKPGLIAVNAAGRRFVNESTSYQLFVEAMYASHGTVAAIPCHFICDSVFVRRYGLGMIRPRMRTLGSYTRDGYVIEAGSILELARRLNVPPTALADTIARHNGFAETGQDEDFGKGGNSYNRNLGDPQHVGPNPCLGPIATPPFYALTIVPADIGTSEGLLTDVQARVIDGDGAAIPGLYAVGNDMSSVMGGVYPAPGITLGPGMAFAYAAAQDMAAVHAKA